MPLNYAHYRFGAAMLASMPADLRRSVNRFRQLYDVGLHGPDIFAYGTPIPGSKLRALGEKLHQQTGREFFGRISRGLRLEPTEAGVAYLYGLLSHYCLDSLCRPFLKAQEADSEASLQEMETEFDRYLLELDNKIPPYAQDMSLHMRLTPGECETVAKFYTGITDGQVKDCVRNMAMVTRLLAGSRRSLVQKALQILPGQADAMVMTPGPNPRCAHLDEELLGCYEAAARKFTSMLLQLNAHLTYNAPLGEDFATKFNG